METLALRQAMHYNFFCSTSGSNEKKKNADFQINTFKVDGGITPSVLLCSQWEAFPAIRTQWSVFPAIASGTDHFLKWLNFDPCMADFLKLFLVTDRKYANQVRTKSEALIYSTCSGYWQLDRSRHFQLKLAIGDFFFLISQCVSQDTIVLCCVAMCMHFRVLFTIIGTAVQ